MGKKLRLKRASPAEAAAPLAARQKTSSSSSSSSSVSSSSTAPAAFPLFPGPSSWRPSKPAEKNKREDLLQALRIKFDAVGGGALRGAGSAGGSPETFPRFDAPDHDGDENFDESEDAAGMFMPLEPLERFPARFADNQLKPTLARPALGTLPLLLLLMMMATVPPCLGSKTDVDVDVLIVGAGWAGLAAAEALSSPSSSLSVHVLEASDRVGGRTRNYDIATGKFDTISDDVVEVGGTFVSPGHTALIALAKSVGVEVFNASWAPPAAAAANAAAAAAATSSSRTSPIGEPPDQWPWWWWSVDTDSKLKARSVWHGFSGTRTFTSAKDANETLLDPATSAELDQAGKAIFAAADSIKCEPPLRPLQTSSHDKTAVGTTKSKEEQQEEQQEQQQEQQEQEDAWLELDSQTFEGWIRKTTTREESRVVLRNMCRGMIAQEPGQVSFLSIARSMKGCWSSGDDDQYRLRGGTQAPPLRIAAKLLGAAPSKLTLSSPVRSVRSAASSAEEAAGAAANVTAGVASAGAGAGAGAGADAGADAGAGGPATTPRRFVVTSDRVTAKASFVILTGTPSALLGIDTTGVAGRGSSPSSCPSALAAATDVQLLQRMPMGTSLKYFVIYRGGAWWRRSGLTGTIAATAVPPALRPSVGADLPALSCQDHSPYRAMTAAAARDGGAAAAAAAAPAAAALMCWMEGETNLAFLALSKEDRRRRVLAYLVGSYNDTRAASLEPSVLELNWAEQDFIRGAYTGFYPPGVQSQPAFWQAILRDEKSPGLFVAGADYTPGFGNGYIEGAVRAGQGVAKRIMLSRAAA